MVVEGFSNREVEIAAIVSASDGRINCRRDAVVFFRSPPAAHACGIRADRDGRYFVHNQSAQYESLQFVLFYPRGVGGWYCVPPKPTLEAGGPAGASAQEDGEGALIAFQDDTMQGGAGNGGEGGGEGGEEGDPAAQPQQQQEDNNEREDGEQVYADLDAAGDEEPTGEGGEDNRLDGEGVGTGAHAKQPEKSKWKRPVSTAGKSFTLFTFLKCLLFQCVLFAVLPRLGQEYLLDGYSRWQEITLAAVQNQKAVKFSTTRRAALASAGRGDPIGTPLPTVMPASVPGSQRYQQTLIENGMAIISKYGKPTYWITMTCNPLWPEFGSMTPKECEYWDSSQARREEMLASNEVARDRVDLQVRCLPLFCHR